MGNENGPELSFLMATIEFACVIDSNAFLCKVWLAIDRSSVVETGLERTIGTRAGVSPSSTSFRL
jgi:hypothetical protein